MSVLDVTRSVNLWLAILSVPLFWRLAREGRRDLARARGTVYRPTARVLLWLYCSMLVMAVANAAFYLYVVAGGAFTRQVGNARMILVQLQFLLVGLGLWQLQRLWKNSDKGG